MFRRILIWLAVFVAISLIILWILSGGIGKTVRSVGGFFSLTGTASSSAPFRLPWEPAELLRGPDLSGIETIGSSVSQSTGSTYDSLSQEYEDLQKAVTDARDFGTPSPYRGQAHIETQSATNASVDDERVRVTAARDNTAPIDITGWSLQSAVSGVRAFIPRGAANFRMGVVNEQTNIRLPPGGVADIASGVSPVGTSVRENICSGYLNQLQTFTPSFIQSCPSPSDVLPVTADNVRVYGETCIDFARSLFSCQAPLQSFTPDLSQSCVTFLGNALSYNGCFEMYRYRSDFIQDAWRVYLGAGHELWRNSHDVIRLLDAEGRTVDAVTY